MRHLRIIVIDQLANKADVNAQNGSGWTPLHIAASQGQKDVAELLLAHGAEVNAKTYHGETPLYWAAENGYQDMAELLRQHNGHE